MLLADLVQQRKQQYPRTYFILVKRFILSTNNYFLRPITIHNIIIIINLRYFEFNFLSILDIQNKLALKIRSIIK